MRALEHHPHAAAGNGPPRNAHTIKGWVLWLLTSAMLLTTLMLFASVDGEWTLARALICATLTLVTLCLVLALISQRRFWWALRVIAGVVCFGYVAYVFDAAFSPPVSGDNPLLPRLFLATLGFLFWGLPSLCFMLWGHVGGKLARGDVKNVTPMDLWTAELLKLLVYATFIALCVYGVLMLLALVRG